MQARSGMLSPSALWNKVRAQEFQWQEWKEKQYLSAVPTIRGKNYMKQNHFNPTEFSMKPVCKYLQLKVNGKLAREVQVKLCDMGTFGKEEEHCSVECITHWIVMSSYQRRSTSYLLEWFSICFSFKKLTVSYWVFVFPGKKSVARLLGLRYLFWWMSGGCLGEEKFGKNGKYCNSSCELGLKSLSSVDCFIRIDKAVWWWGL